MFGVRVEVADRPGSRLAFVLRLLTGQVRVGFLSARFSSPQGRYFVVVGSVFLPCWLSSSM